MMIDPLIPQKGIREQKQNVRFIGFPAKLQMNNMYLLVYIFSLFPIYSLFPPSPL